MDGQRRHPGRRGAPDLQPDRQRRSRNRHRHGHRQGPAAEIADGKVEGDVATFSFVTNYHGDPLKLLCKVQVTDDGLKIQMGTEDGGWSTEFLAKKAS